MKTWWLSFAAVDRFLGLVLVDALSFEDAFVQACRAGVNPGGEAVGFAIEDHAADLNDPEVRAILGLPRLRLLQKADWVRGGVVGVTLNEARASGLYDMGAAEGSLDRICEGCNAPSAVSRP